MIYLYIIEIYRKLFIFTKWFNKSNNTWDVCNIIINNRNILYKTIYNTLQNPDNYIEILHNATTLVNDKSSKIPLSEYNNIKSQLAITKNQLKYIN